MDFFVLVLVLVLECPLIMPWGVEDEDESEDEDEIRLRLCRSGSSVVDPQKPSQEKKNSPFSGTEHTESGSPMNLERR